MSCLKTEEEWTNVHHRRKGGSGKGGREGAFFVGMWTPSVRLVRQEPPAAAPDVLLEEMSHAGGGWIQPRPSGSEPPTARMSFSIDMRWTGGYFTLPRSEHNSLNMTKINTEEEEYNRMCVFKLNDNMKACLILKKEHILYEK